MSVSDRIVVDVSIDEATSTAHVFLAGEIDVAVEAELTNVVDRLATSSCRAVSIDLAEVTFAGTTLLTFLVRVVSQLSLKETVVLSNEPWPVRDLVDLAGLGPMVGLGSDAAVSRDGADAGTVGGA